MTVKLDLSILRYFVVLLITFCTIHVNGQTNFQAINFYGKVHEKGKGIPGVPVTDGLTIVLTDEEGNYTLSSNAFGEFIYITIPSGYNIQIKNNSPYFFRHIEDKKTAKQKFDFELEKSPYDDNTHTVIVCADPQVAFDEELPILQGVIDDMQTVTEYYTKYNPVFGIVCGDIIAEIEREPKYLSLVKKMFNDTGSPFFYVAGNHDMDVSGRSNYRSKKTYENNFGPTYYSFNRGKVHYVMLDNVFFTGRSYGYIGYLDEVQLSWLEQDLALVPEGSTVIMTMHIPTYSREARRGEYGKEEINKVLQNRRALYEILEPYNVHIMSGHEHYNENYVISSHIFEHVHAALSGIFWQAPFSSDGTPLGYSVYEIDGNDIQWYYKVAGKDKNVQFNAYSTGADKNKPDAIIANVWNYDSEWKVYWYENGERVGEMTRYTGWDPAIVNYVENNNHNFRYQYIGAGPTDHLFYAIPLNKTSEIEIKVVDRFNNTYIKKPMKTN